MSVGQGGGKKHKVTPQMNVTPLVDVVLVLLIIFMVVTPLLTKQFWINVPKKADEVKQPLPDDSKPPVVLSLAADGTLRINKDTIRRDDIGRRLPRIFSAQGDATLVFDAEDGAPYGEAVKVMDLARAAGAVTIAVSSRELK
ncbi:ExbD/TolR family protein [Vulgatibacter sp.]|uniref:ExbD/TolR family protein n=1 Tax=Vulgatibacter sp. TaxID=1971226 RepID=UPI00356256EC